MTAFCPGFFVVLVTLAGSLTAIGQETDIERTFDQRKSSYKLERFHEVDDPAPDSKYGRRFDYLYYKESDQLTKIRVIESETEDGKASSIKVDDYFFLKGQLRLVRLYFFASGNRLEIIKNGAIVPLLTGEHIEFENGVLTKWTALGKNIPRTDKRWADKQTSAVINARIEIQKYESFKNPK